MGSRVEKSGIGPVEEPREYLGVAEAGGMAGRRVAFGQRLTKAAEAISQFKPTRKFWAANRENVARTADPSAQAVVRQLNKLHAAGRMNFIDAGLSPANLKQYNAQISTVLKFLEAHGSHFNPEQIAALRHELLATRLSLMQECLTRIQHEGTSPEDQKKLCALANQAFSEIPFDVNNPENVRLWKQLSQHLTDITAANTALAPLLAPSAKIIQRNMLAINKEEAKHIEPGGEREKIGEDVHRLGRGRTKMRLEGPVLAGVQRQAGAHPSRWNTLKAKIAEFFGRVGRSAESQAASEVLISDVRAAYGHECGGGPKPPAGVAKAFFDEVIKPLTDNKWFQGTLRNNAVLRNQFEEVKTSVLTAMIDDLEHSPLASAENNIDTLRALQGLKREVEGLRNEGADKTHCARLIAAIDAKQADCVRAVFDEINRQIPNTRPMSLRTLSAQLRELRNEVDADVFKGLRINFAGVESAINGRRQLLEREGVQRIATQIQNARETADFSRIKRALDEFTTDDVHPATRRLAAQHLRELDERYKQLQSFSDSLERATENFLTEDHRLQNPGKFLKDVDAVLTFLNNEPDSPQNRASAATLFRILEEVMQSALIGAQLGEAKFTQLKALARRCQVLPRGD